MAIAITWIQDGQSASIVINDSAQASLENYRQSLTQWVMRDGQSVPQPLYSTILEMILGVTKANVITAAMNLFPPANIQEAAAAAQEANQALAEARDAFMQSAIQQQ